jgi:hypothetical protein
VDVGPIFDAVFSHPSFARICHHLTRVRRIEFRHGALRMVIRGANATGMLTFVTVGAGGAFLCAAVVPGLRGAVVGA